MAEASPRRSPVPAAPPVQDGAKWGMEDWSWNSQTCHAVPKGQGPPGPTSAGAAGASEPVQALPQVKDAPAPGAMSEDVTAGTSSADVVPAVRAPPKPAAFHAVRPGFCQADGCGKNLSKLTFYHARNKICDVHIKADVFTRGGVPLRFCQRCGNAHDLSEFDGTKHSCRAQLEKHNARRRKRQAEAGTAAPKKEKSGKQQKKVAAAALKGADNTDEGEPAAAAVVPARRSNRRRTAPSYSQLNGEADVEEGEPQAAAPAEPQDQGGWGAELASLPVVQLPEETPGQAVADPPEDVFVDDLSAWLTSHLAEMDDLQGAGPVAASLPPASPRESMGGVAPPLPESADSFDLAVGLMNPLELICADLSPRIDALALPTAPKLTKSAMLSTVSVKLFGCTPAELPDDLRSQLTSWFFGNVASLDGYLRPGCVHLTVQATVEPEAPADEAAAAEAEVKGEEEGAAAGTTPTRGTKRCTPEGDGAGRALQGGLATGGVARLVEKMMASGDPLWRTKTLLVQAGTEVALVHGGKLQQAWDVEAGPARRAVPAVLDVQPMVLLAGDCGGGGGKRKGGKAPESVRVVAKGMNLLQDDCEVVCRLQGEYVPVESAGCDECSCAAAVRACCRKPDAAGEATSSKDWEARCCGCCVSKIASLGVEQDPGQPASSGCCGSGAQARSTTAPASVDTVAQQVLSMHVGGTLRPGVLHVDVLKRAYMAPRGGRVLVVDSPAVHEELLTLAASAPAAGRAWVDALGVVYEWVGDRSKMAYSTVERTASRLLHEALGFGLLETAKTLHALLQGELITAAAAVQLPRSRGPADGLALLSQADQACRSATLLRAAKLGCVDGLTMVHRTVQSQNPAALDLVLGWGRDAEAPWRCDTAGPRGLTPLHMAVLVKDHAVAARMVLTLVDGCEPGVSAWLEAVTEDGKSPAEFAARAGREGLLATFGGKNNVGVRPVEEEEEEDVHGDMEAPSTPRRCRCAGDCPCARSAEPCASCASFTDDDDACCGDKDGTCCCCTSSAAPEAAGCCAAKAAVKSCCQ